MKLDEYRVDISRLTEDDCNFLDEQNFGSSRMRNMIGDAWAVRIKKDDNLKGLTIIAKIGRLLWWDCIYSLSKIATYLLICNVFKLAKLWDVKEIITFTPFENRIIHRMNQKFTQQSYGNGILYTLEI